MWRRVLAKNRVSTRLPVASASPLAARLHTSPAIDTQAPQQAPQDRPSVFNVAKAAAHHVQTQHINGVSGECCPSSAAAATNGAHGAAPSGTEPLSKKKLKKLKKKENHEAHVKHLEHQGQTAADESVERRRENHNTGADLHPQQQHQHQHHQHQHHASKKKKKKAPAVTDSTSVVDAAQRTVPGAYGAFDGAITASQFHAQFAHVSGPPAPGRAADVKVGGRVVSVRAMGKLMFVTLRSDGVNLQVVLQVSDALSKDALHELRHTLRPGDVIGCAGSPGRTKAGELSLFAGTAPSVLAPYVCSDITTCPDQRSFSSGIVDEDLRHRYRFIDMISNPEANDRFRMRHRVLQSLREFFNSDGFVEVETPMFHSVPGGAAAKPFVTHHLANDCDLFLRIAPELYLKQCVVGGLERVYEVGRVFRNEDSDRSHNPEFTSCEFYQAYATYRDLVPKTEALVRHIALAATGSTTVRVVRTSGAVKECPSASSSGKTTASSTTGSPDAQDQKAQSGGPEIVEIDFSKPFRTVSVVPALQEALGVTFPPMAELDTPAGAALLTGLLMKHKIQLPSVRTPAKLFDKLIDHFITDDVVEPTFVMDHPVFMSPLAKAHPDGSGLSERFELFVNGMELCNAYSELNDPVEQHRRFEQQLRQRAMGDDESHSIDETFLKALQFGLPPTAGWGMGIDRLVMLLSGSQCIRDVIIFPLLKQDTNSHDTRRRRRTASFFNVDPHMTMFCLSSLEAELVRRGEQRGCTQLRSLRALLDEMAKEREAEGQPGRSPFAGACGLGAKGGKQGGLFGYYGTLHKGHEMMWSFIVNMMCRRPD